MGRNILMCDNFTIGFLFHVNLAIDWTWHARILQWESSVKNRFEDECNSIDCSFRNDGTALVYFIIGTIRLKWSMFSSANCCFHCVIHTLEAIHYLVNFGSMRIDHEVALRNVQSVFLPSEFSLIVYLAKFRHKIISATVFYCFVSLCGDNYLFTTSLVIRMDKIFFLITNS